MLERVGRCWSPFPRSDRIYLPRAGKRNNLGEAGVRRPEIRKLYLVHGLMEWADQNSPATVFALRPFFYFLFHFYFCFYFYFSPSGFSSTMSATSLPLPLNGARPTYARYTGKENENEQEHLLLVTCIYPWQPAAAMAIAFLVYAGTNRWCPRAGCRRTAGFNQLHYSNFFSQLLLESPITACISNYMSSLHSHKQSEAIVLHSHRPVNARNSTGP